MSDERQAPLNGGDPAERWQAHLAAVAAGFPYPATPNLAPAVRRALGPTASRPAPRRGLAWAGLATAMLLIAALLAVPGVRAGLLEFLQIGSVRIQLRPTSTPTASPTAAPSPSGTPPAPTATVLASVLDLAGATTLEAARAGAGFPIRLPAYPADLGPPDEVFLQDLDGQAVILVWLEPGRADAVRLSLHALTSDEFAHKILKEGPVQLDFTRVKGREAVWTTGPYTIRTGRGELQTTRLVEGHVLIWEEGGLTYRLETSVPLDEAVKIAESLKE